MKIFERGLLGWGGAGIIQNQRKESWKEKQKGKAFWKGSRI